MMPSPVAAAGTKVAGAVVVGLTGAALMWSLSVGQPSGPVAPVVAPAVLAAPPPSEKPLAMPEPTSPVEAERVLPSPPAPPSRSARPPAPRVAPSRADQPMALEPPAPPGVEDAPVEDALAREAALLETARAAMASSPDTALAETERHATEFPDGQLSAERELLAIDALGRLRRHDEARARAQGIAARFPQGILTERVQRILRRNGSATIP